MANVLSEEQFRCSICLDIFKNPVSIPCGHNFCLECIKRYWDTRQKAECPLCKEVFRRRPLLKINCGLKDITEKWLQRSHRDRQSYKPCPKPRSSRHPSLSDVPCDACHTDKIMAVLSCLVCKMSYCEIHLTPHLRDPVMIKHKLMDPATFSSTHICKRHNMFLTMFCVKDQKPVCLKCTETDHKSHTTISISNRSEKIKIRMKEIKVKCQQMIQERCKKAEEIKNSVELSKMHKESERQESLQVFRMVISEFEKNQALLFEEMEQKQVEAERTAGAFLKELEQEIDELQKRCTDIQYLEYTEDSLHLVQSYPSLSAPLTTRNWSMVNGISDIYTGTMRRQISKLVDICQEIERKLCAEEVSKFDQYAVDITLDPETASGWLILSSDRKKVSVCSQQRRLSSQDDHRRFDSCVSILGAQRFTNGKHYWVVQVGDKTDWDLGVARESINRKGAITVRPDSGFWAICRRKGGSLIACAGPSVTLQLQEPPQKVGILLDYEQGLVSFYNAEAKTHIYTYSGCSFPEPLYPYFNPCLHEHGKNMAPLVICPLEA